MADRLTEADHYRAKYKAYRALCFSLITRLEDDEYLMRDLIQEFRTLQQSPEYRDQRWIEKHGIPFD